MYVIRKDVADYERLVREGCAPVAYQSEAAAAVSACVDDLCHT